MNGEMNDAPVTELPTLWTPPADVRTSTVVGRYLGWLERERGRTFADYDELWRWSVDDLEGFWSSVWSYFEVGPPVADHDVLADASMPGARWFPGVTLNYAAHALRTTGDGLAVIARSQSRDERRLTWDELTDLVGRCRAGLRRLGVERGDRVVAYLPNGPEALVAFLATAGLGAVWASCPPEFGPQSVIDRFGQLDPVVLLATRGYRYGAKEIDRTAEVDAIVAALPTLRTVVEVDTGWDDLLADPAAFEVEPVPFDHPLYVLFSSGTTGPPKAIVHGHGGILLEHLKALGLHQDLGPGDRFFWFSTTGWMMWNFLVSGLCVGATIVLFDGDPGWPDLGALWRMAAETGVTAFGTSAPFLLACRSAGLTLDTATLAGPGGTGGPGDSAGRVDLSRVRSVGSTGAPLPVEGFEWVDEQLPHVWLTSISGGTDVCTAFVGGSPLVPVVAGEISCRFLGAAVEAFDDDGRSLVGEQGELVITRPMPSMPVGFWGDDDGHRYRDAYFDRFPGVWCHGDWITITERGSCTITGRSDATLNRGGVRLGTSELYSVIEAVDGVADSLVVHLEDPGGGPGKLVLFVALDDRPDGGSDGSDAGGPGDRDRLAEAVELGPDDPIRTGIAGALRAKLSPRHVPDVVVAVPAIPKTHSGKKIEVPVKRILQGADPARAVTPGALAHPGALDAFVGLDLTS